MFKHINKILGGEFARNVIKLMTGTTVAQAIPVAISPILTRLYSPKDFGVLALFTSITAILGAIANGRYELAIVLPVNDEDAINITACAILIAVGFSISLLFIIILFHVQLVKLLGSDEIALWLYFVPLVVFLTGLFNALKYFHTRRKLFSDVAKATINKSISLAIVQMGVGLIKSGATGLISGQIMASITGNGTLILNVVKEKKLLKSINRFEMKRLAKRYIDFPKFSMWSILANKLAYNLTNIFLSSFYSTGALGFYSLGNRVLGTPSSLIGSSIGQVFFQKATEERNKTGRALKTFKSTFKGLIIIALPIFLILYFVVEELFAFVFGEEWRIAGQYARIMMPLFFVTFLVSPLSMINNVFEKQKIALSWQISLLVSTLLVFYFTRKLDLGIIEFLRVVSSTYLILYLILFYILYKVAGGGE